MPGTRSKEERLGSDFLLCRFCWAGAVADLMAPTVKQEARDLRKYVVYNIEINLEHILCVMSPTELDLVRRRGARARARVAEAKPRSQCKDVVRSGAGTRGGDGGHGHTHRGHHGIGVMTPPAP